MYKRQVINLAKKEFFVYFSYRIDIKMRPRHENWKDYVRSDQKLYDVTDRFEINKRQKSTSEDDLCNNNSEWNISGVDEIS